MQNQEELKLGKDEIKQFLQSKTCQIDYNQIYVSIEFLSQYGYRVVQLIDYGNFGVVMKANDIQNNKRVVAIKLIIVTDSDILKENIQEYQKSILINHSNVVKNYQQLYDDQNDCYFIISEFCQKGNLFNYFKSSNNNIKKEEIIQICIQLIEGLMAIHDKNIVHSDLKPQNILISSDNKIKICDLGMSKQLLGSKSETISKGGSLNYMAPEQIEGKICKQSDIYSVGSIICFLCNVNVFGLNLFSTKKGIFPSIEDNSFKELVILAFQMMSVEPQNRIQLEDCLDQLKQFQKSYSEDNQKGKIVVKRWNDEWKRSLLYFTFIIITVLIYYTKINYYGEFGYDKQENFGVLEYINCNKYHGNFKNGLRNDRDIVYFNELYEQVNDKMEDFGIYEWRDGQRYEGNFKNGDFNGKGIYYFKETDTLKMYDGYWVNHKKEGEGILEWKDGQKYEGNFKNDLLNGKGILYFSELNSSKKYDGEWLNDQMEGFGIYEWRDGQRYEGNFKNGYFNGKGIYYFKETDTLKKYNGYWVNHKKEGKGILEWRDGQRYEGNFKNDLINGKGILYFSEQNSSKKYDGEWVNDKQEGFGIYEWRDGQRYEGNFKNGDFNGKGTYYYKETDTLKKYDGQWVNHKKEGFGILEYRNGSRYEGNFKNDQKNGRGIQFDKNDQKVQGEWVDDMFKND